MSVFVQLTSSHSLQIYNVCLGSYSWGILLSCSNYLSWDLSNWRSSFFMLRGSRNAMKHHNSFNFLHKSHFECLFVIAFFWSLLKIHEHRWGLGLPFFIAPILSLIMQNLHNSTCFAWSNIQFFIVLSITRECILKTLELLHLLQWYSTILQKTLDRVSRKIKYLSFRSADFYSSYVTCSCKAI